MPQGFGDMGNSPGSGFGSLTRVPNIDCVADIFALLKRPLREFSRLKY
jgi:hypothetical protein